MAIIKCKMCGGDIELAADKTFGTCEYCGSTMTFPKLDDDQRASAFNRGNHFRRIGEFDKALAVYERIVREDDTDAEAHWCCALCRFGIEYVEDPATYEWLPTCHRASFDSFLEDVDYLAALEHSDGITRRQYQKDAMKIAEVQRGILATSQNAEPYDVFICYKESDGAGDRTKDSALAQEIYYQLTEQGRKVFFARITLEDVAGAQYEPYIFAALNSAKVMVVVGTKPEHLSAVWVKNEWSRFLAMMKKDRSKLLLPCYRDMDPYDLPEQLSVLQSYDMGKIGFIQDLTRGIAKVLDAQAKPVAVQETMIVQQAASSNVSALLERGKMALEDEEWEKADGFFEEVLNQDPHNAEAYLGKFLLSARASSMEELATARLTQTEEADTELVSGSKVSDEMIAQMREEFYVPGYLQEQDIRRICAEYKDSYRAETKARQAQLQAEQAWWEDHKTLEKALKFGKETLKQQIQTAKQQIFDRMEQRLQSAIEADAAANDALLVRLRLLLQKNKDMVDIRRERDYLEASKMVEQESVVEQEAAIRLLRKLGDYKYSIILLQKAEMRVKKINETATRRRQLIQQKSELQTELSHMGVFGNRARKQELQAQLQKVEKELLELK